MKLHKDGLARFLRDMAACIDGDDSFEGTITYTASDPDFFEVSAFYRYGNKDGQGSCVLVEATENSSMTPVTTGG